MSITSMDKLLSSLRPVVDIYKYQGSFVASRPASLVYSIGYPGAMTAPTCGTTGQAITSFAGQIPFSNPTSGNTHLSSLYMAASVNGTMLVCDRLWHNSGLSATSTSAQTVNSCDFAARDDNGQASGKGVLVGVEVSTAVGAGTGTFTMTYTNSDGTSGRSVVSPPVAANATPGWFFPIGLQAGDVGVRSIQTIQQSATWTTGAYSLVAYRVIARVTVPFANCGEYIDPFSGGFPRLYDNTSLFLIWIPTATTITHFVGSIVYAQG